MLIGSACYKLCEMYKFLPITRSAVKYSSHVNENVERASKI